MKNFRKVSAFLLALLMLVSSVLLNSCDGGNAEYEVKVVDAQGNACTEGVIVKFLQNGTQVAMQPVD